MSRKAFHVGIDLDIHAVSCPGVWLCPKGGAMIRISMLGTSAHTKRVEPSFPLLFHECFHFRKTFTGVTSLTGLQTELTKRLVRIQLVQWQVHGCQCILLAAFCSPLSELLYPQPATRGQMAGVDVDLLMETTPCFPGIIAPKVEVSTKVIIEEMVNYPIHSHDSVTGNPQTVFSKKLDLKSGILIERPVKVKGRVRDMANSGHCSKMRQKPVCHTRPRVKCNSCKQRVDWSQKQAQKKPKEKKKQQYCLNDSFEKDNTVYLPYCNRCGDVVQEKEVKQGKVIVKNSLQCDGKWETVCSCVEHQPSKSVCECNLCHKYNSYFKKPALTSVDVERSYSLERKSPNLRPNRSLSPPKKETHYCCSCICGKAENGERQRAGCSNTKPSYQCPLSWNDNQDLTRNDGSDLEALTKVDGYQNMFKADLENHYKRLYERVSRKNNKKLN